MEQLEKLAQDLRCAISFSRMASIQGEPQEYLSLLEQCAVVIEGLLEHHREEDCVEQLALW